MKAFLSSGCAAISFASVGRVVRFGMPRCFALAIAAVSTSCVYSDAQIHVETAPSFVREHNTVSVFGVFRRGRMQPEAWSDLAPALGLPTCETVFGDRHRDQAPVLYDNVAERPTEEG